MKRRRPFVEPCRTGVCHDDQRHVSRRSSVQAQSWIALQKQRAVARAPGQPPLPGRGRGFAAGSSLLAERWSRFQQVIPRSLCRRSSGTVRRPRSTRHGQGPIFLPRRPRAQARRSRSRTTRKQTIYPFLRTANRVRIRMIRTIGTMTRRICTPVSFASTSATPRIRWDSITWVCPRRVDQVSGAAGPVGWRRHQPGDRRQIPDGASRVHLPATLFGYDPNARITIAGTAPVSNSVWVARQRPLPRRR